MPRVDQLQGLPPEERQRDWSEPQEEPILDAARVPLRAFRANKPTRSAYLAYLWLHALRPLLVVAFWIAVVLYAWRHFFQPTRSLDDSALLTLYAGLIGIIFLVMLVLAPLRKRVVDDEATRTQAPDSSMALIARSAGVEPERLSGWQQLRRLSVLHDDEGRVSQAADLDTEAALLEPVRKRAGRR
ncbi:MAG: poly-beta-1,6-N-acetyl-D-glucosamine biosynthesis protein PgaD [Gammaproteobacteria bacterium]|nr:poly-beta-1,6-N-acetyl-D-glucosamine biosynthesis protein PgaD [Gammaproteobacteria bacterium]MBU1444414.1 poly-beta-1,6-N-acetyl-D-glucosamine biosynthesis protein PgaD [Gammaproteobacteria bacterium]